MLLIFAGPFSMFYFITLTRVSAIVPSPENLTVSCQNSQVFVYWNYSKQLPQTSFKLELLDYHYVTNKLQHNLTEFIWASEKRYMALHSVTLKAIQGSNESMTVQSKSFTFNYYETAAINCELDFPPVKLAVKQWMAKVSFENPLHSNKNLKGSSLIYWVNQSDNVLMEAECSRKVKICTVEIPVKQSKEKHCLTLKGQMGDSENVFSTRFKETDICSYEEPSQDPYLLFLFIITAVFVIVIIVLTLIIWKVKAWVTRPTTQPKILLIDPRFSTVRYQSITLMGLLDPMLSNYINHLVEFSDEKVSSITHLASNLLDTLDTSTSLTSNSSQATPLGSMYMEGGLSGSSNQDWERTSLLNDSHNEEESIRYYTSRPNLVMGEVDMGDDDMVEWYCAS